MESRCKHKWRLTFEDESEVEFWLQNYRAMQQDDKEVELGMEAYENPELYSKLQDELRSFVYVKDRDSRIICPLAFILANWRITLQQQSLIKRFQKWVAVAIAFCAFLYVGWSVWVGYDKIKAQLSSFQWSMFLWGILLTLTNYSLRFAKWRYYLKRLGVSMPISIDTWNFLLPVFQWQSLPPGKAERLLKPYVVREVTKVPMIKTLPALITERLTDGIAMLILAELV